MKKLITICLFVAIMTTVAISFANSSVAGVWGWIRPYNQELDTDNVYMVNVVGDKFTARIIQPAMGVPTEFIGTISGNNISGIAVIDWSDWPQNGGRRWEQPTTGTVSSDGKTITFQYETINRKYGPMLTDFRGWEAKPETWILKKIR